MAKLSPIFNDEQLDNNGLPLVGGEVIFYLAGTSTVTDTYTNSSETTLQTSPIVLNYRGEPTFPIWLADGLAYKARLFDTDGVLLREYDNITGINDASITASTNSEWTGNYDSTYIGATSFSVLGDQTSILHVNRRTKSQATAGLVYGTITSSVFASGLTTIVQVNDSLPLDSGLTETQYGILSYTPKSFLPSIPSGSKTTFFQSAAPVGWTQITDHDNKMLRVVSGTGGGSGGSDSPILNNKVTAHTHTFTTGDESNDHTHSYTVPDGNALFDVGLFSAVTGTAAGTTGGASSSHTHSGTTANNAGASNWTPLYISMILCQKD